MTTAAARQPAAPNPGPDSGTRTAQADRFAAARAVADALLYEGYLLYPYRRSSAKNRVRWQFGVLAPPAWIRAQQIPDPGVAGSAESWFQQAECLAEASPEAHVSVRLRFLQLQRKQCFALDADGHREPVDELHEGTTTHLTFDEALAREVDFEQPLADLLSGERVLPVSMPGGHSTLPVTGADGLVVGHVERTTWPITARLVLSAARAEAPFPLLRLTIRVENVDGTAAPGQPRTEILRHALIATHVLVGLDTGGFLSLLDPPAWAAPAAAQCTNRHVFPVLAGADDGYDALLCSPIILYDHPKVAPESPGDLHDAVEIDEILSLRALTMTDAEKSEARATDPRAAEIVDRVDTMPPEMMAKLHGAIRDVHPLAATPTNLSEDDLPWWDPRAEAAVQPHTDTVLVAGRRIGRGSLVRLHPRGHGTDAHDMFLAGRTARVHAVLHDVDGSLRVAVNLADDPAADLLESYGRFFHFAPEEIEPLGIAP